MENGKKIVCAFLAICVLTLMFGGCRGYCNMGGLGYTDCTVSGCYLFGKHYPSAEFKRESEACCQAVKENKDALDFAAESLLQYGSKVRVYFVDGAAIVECEDSEIFASIEANKELMSCFDQLAQNPWFAWISPMQFSLSDPDSIYGICVNFNISIPAYDFSAEYITDPEMLKYTGINIVGDWYFTDRMMG